MNCRIAALVGLWLYVPITLALDLQPCGDDGARCGRHPVWENRDAASGRRIELQVKVYPATGPDPAADPVFFFAGGPGAALSAWSPGVFASIRQRRDVVLVDQRGTGGSSPLHCDNWDQSSTQALLDPYLETEEVRVCRDRLMEQADLRFYTTVQHVDDVDEVRESLGYERINLSGGSYGTKPVQVYLRRHPEYVRSAVLHGVTTLSSRYPLQAPFAGQHALDRMIDACRADPACRDPWGDPKAHLEQILAGFSDGPRTISLDGNAVILRREVLMEGIRHIMYNAHGTVRLPAMFQRAARSGDLAELTRAVLRFEAGFVEGPRWASGLWLSVSCSEDAHQITEQDLARARNESLFGDYRPRVHRDACRLWPQGDLPEGFHQPVQSDVPVLIINGELDSATPPWNARAIARHLPISRVVTPQEGHGFSDRRCANRVILSFLDDPDPATLDVRCLEAVTLPAWSSR